MHKLAKKVKLHHDDNEWFWKSGKRGYKDMLMQLTKEDRAIRIQKYGEEAISAFPIGWISFHRDHHLNLSLYLLMPFLRWKY